MNRQLLILMIVGVAAAQNPPLRRGAEGEERGRMEMVKMWRLTEELELTEEQAAKFFPRYRALMADFEEIRKERRGLLEEIRKGEGEGKELKASDVEKVISRAQEMERRRSDREFEFIRKLSDILTPQQVIRYAAFEARFKERLMDAVREQRGQDQPDPDRPRPPKRRKLW